MLRDVISPLFRQNSTLAKTPLVGKQREATSNRLPADAAGNAAGNAAVDPAPASSATATQVERVVRWAERFGDMHLGADTIAGGGDALDYLGELLRTLAAE